MVNREIKILASIVLYYAGVVRLKENADSIKHQEYGKLSILTGRVMREPSPSLLKTTLKVSLTYGCLQDAYRYLKEYYERNIVYMSL